MASGRNAAKVVGTTPSEGFLMLSYGERVHLVVNFNFRISLILLCRKSALVSISG